MIFLGNLQVAGVHVVAEVLLQDAGVDSNGAVQHTTDVLTWKCAQYGRSGLTQSERKLIYITLWSQLVIIVA